MKTAGIAIDSYKLPVFKKHLEAAGYEYTEHPGLSPNTLLLKVKTVSVAKLQPVIERANEEAKKS